MIDDIVAFLRARLDEDEPVIAENKRVLIGLYEDAVREYESQPTEINRSYRHVLQYTVLVLAEGYDRHPEYLEEWRQRREEWQP